MIGVTYTSHGTALISCKDPPLYCKQLSGSCFGDIRAFGICTFDNAVYISGGRNFSSRRYLRTMKKYDVITACWTSLMSMPIYLCGHTAHTVNGSIYIIGGVEMTKSTFAHILKYDNCHQQLESYKRDE